MRGVNAIMRHSRGQLASRNGSPPLGSTTVNFSKPCELYPTCAFRFCPKLWPATNGVAHFPRIMSEDRRNHWNFENTEKGWAWAVSRADGTREASQQSFKTLKECA